MTKFKKTYCMVMDAIMVCAICAAVLALGTWQFLESGNYWYFTR
jgi:hypothetical protein